MLCYDLQVQHSDFMHFTLTKLIKCFATKLIPKKFCRYVIRIQNCYPGVQSNIGENDVYFYCIQPELSVITLYTADNYEIDLIIVSK